MAQHGYPYHVNQNFLYYAFDSIGPNGTIKKAVRFRPMQEGRFIYFNVVLGDVVSETTELDDMARTNNNDRDLVLTTVSNIILDFFDHFPTTTIHVQGSTTSRTRLYQIMISQNLETISSFVEVRGYIGTSFEAIRKNINYTGFIARRKWLPSGFKVNNWPTA